MPYIGKKPADVISRAVDLETGTFSGEVVAGSLDISGNKVVLEATDQITIDCSVADKVSGTLSIMEIT